MSKFCETARENIKTEVISEVVTNKKEQNRSKLSGAFYI